MPFDWNRHLRHTARHLARMFEIPAAQEQALHRLDELTLDPTWAGLLEMVPAEMAQELPAFRARRDRQRASRSPSPASRSPKAGPAPAADRAATSASTPPKKP